MFEHAHRIAKCRFTDHTLRTAGMSTRNTEQNAELLTPVEEAFDITPGSLLALLEEANLSGSSHVQQAKVDVHNVLKEHGIYYWLGEPGRTPFIGVIEDSAPIPGTKAQIRAIWLFLEEQVNHYQNYNGLTMNAQGLLLEPVVFRHMYNILAHLDVEKGLQNPLIKEINVEDTRADFISKASVTGCVANLALLREAEGNLLVSTLRKRNVTSFEEIRRIYENDSAMHEAQHYHDLSSYLVYGHIPEEKVMEYGAYLVNLACSPIKQFLLAQHMHKHYGGENPRGIDSMIVDAYMETLDLNMPIELFGLEEEKIAGVAESLLDEHYGEDGFSRCQEYF